MTHAEQAEAAQLTAIFAAAVAQQAQLERETAARLDDAQRRRHDHVTDVVYRYFPQED